MSDSTLAQNEHTRLRRRLVAAPGAFASRGSACEFAVGHALFDEQAEVLEVFSLLGFVEVEPVSVGRLEGWVVQQGMVEARHLGSEGDHGRVSQLLEVGFLHTAQGEVIAGGGHNKVLGDAADLGHVFYALLHLRDLVAMEGLHVVEQS